jgi:hypothetical protein
MGEVSTFKHQFHRPAGETNKPGHGWRRQASADASGQVVG